VLQVYGRKKQSWLGSCIYKYPDCEMKKGIEVRDEEQFANGQKIRDLQVCSDARDVKTQFMDAIDSPYDFFRFFGSRRVE
jgi:hypothetical protein